MADVNPIDLQKALAGADYPAEKKQLAELARSNGADDKLVESISSAPTDRFEGPNEVQKAVFSGGR